MFNGPNCCLHSCDYVTSVDRSHEEMINYCYDSLVTILVEASKTFCTKKHINHIGRWFAGLNALKVNLRVTARIWRLAGCLLPGDLWENN